MIKKSLFMTLIAAAAFSCQSEPEVAPAVDAEEQAENTTENVISLTATAGATTKVAYAEDADSALKATWQEDDKFSLFNVTGDYVGDFVLSEGAGTDSGTFSQVGSFEMTNGVYTAAYPAYEDAEVGTTKLGNYDTEAIRSQDFDAENGHLTSAIRMTSVFAYSAEDETSLNFEYEVALFKLTLSNLPAEYSLSDISQVEVYDGNLEATYILNTAGDYDISTCYIAVMPSIIEEYDVKVRDLKFTFTLGNDEKITITKQSSASIWAGYRYNISLDLTTDDDDYVAEDDEQGGDSTLDYYLDGYTAPNGVTYSSETSGATLITEDTAITGNGVYFIDAKSDDVVVSLNASTIANVVIIGRYSDYKPKVQVSGIQSLGYTSDSDVGVIYKNIDLTGRSSGYTFNFSSSYQGLVDYWVFDDCRITTNTSGAHFFYFSNSTSICAIENIIFTNNVFEVTTAANAAATRIVSIFTINGAGFKYVEATNNIIYAASTSGDDNYNNGALFMFEASKTLDDLTIIYGETPNLEVIASNNTFVNYLCNSNALITVPYAKSVTVENNIFWGDPETSYQVYMLRYNVEPSDDTDIVYPNQTVDGNIFYGLTKNWLKYHGSSNYIPSDESSSIYFTKEESDPLETCDITTGTFTQASGYEDKGATL